MEKEHNETDQKLEVGKREGGRMKGKGKGEREGETESVEHILLSSNGSELGTERIC